MQHTRVCGLLLGIVLGCSSTFVCQTSPQPVQNVTLSGIVLTSDHRRANTNVDDSLCRASDWALRSGGITYLLFGDPAILQHFERQRVTVTGRFERQPVVQYGTRMIRRKIFVRSMKRDELPQSQIERSVAQLRVVPWRGLEDACGRPDWDFSFTYPMLNILQAGRGAEHILLDHINDKAIKDQIVMLLGGVGDENAIGHIIDSMADADRAQFDPNAKRLNCVANIALTNLTVSDVIWHHGGGISPDKCPNDPKSCWTKWWNVNRGSFRVGIAGDRLYSNYPNYGIYAQFGDASIQ